MRAKLVLRRDFLGELFSATEQQRFAEIGDLILADADLWDDLVPENLPPAQRPLFPPAIPTADQPDQRPVR